MSEPIYVPKCGPIFKGDTVYFSYAGLLGQGHKVSITAHSMGSNNGSYWINGTDRRGRIHSLPVTGITRIEPASVESRR